MDKTIKHPSALDGKNPNELRGDPITNDRYFCKDFMNKEWNHMWTKVWLIAGREIQIEEPGDYIKHLKGLVDSQGGASSSSITIATGATTWDVWKSLPGYFSASSGSYPSSFTVFSFTNQTNTNGNYGAATLAAGWATPTQPTGGTHSHVNNAGYKEDYSALLDIINGSEMKI